jgi:hypothetical protein
MVHLFDPGRGTKEFSVEVETDGAWFFLLGLGRLTLNGGLLHQL